MQKKQDLIQPQMIPETDSALLDALAEVLIQTTHDVIEKIEVIETRLDETHAMIVELAGSGRSLPSPG